jgi:hypothetical protein
LVGASARSSGGLQHRRSSQSARRRVAVPSVEEQRCAIWCAPARTCTLALMIRREQLEVEIAEALRASPWAQTAGRLMCLRWIDTLTAAGLCAEIGDFARFRHSARRR